MADTTTLRPQPPKPMADAAVFATIGHVRTLLLIRRDDNGHWALPGGKPEPGESSLDTCIRELHEETGLWLNDATRWYTFTPHRNPDDRYVDGYVWTTLHAYTYGQVNILPTVNALDGVRDCRWFPAPTFADLEQHLLTRTGGTIWKAHRRMIENLLDHGRPADNDLRFSDNFRIWLAGGGAVVVARCCNQTILTITPTSITNPLSLATVIEACEIHELEGCTLPTHATKDGATS